MKTLLLLSIEISIMLTQNGVHHCRILGYNHGMGCLSILTAVFESKPKWNYQSQLSVDMSTTKVISLDNEMRSLMCGKSIHYSHLPGAGGVG